MVGDMSVVRHTCDTAQFTAAILSEILMTGSAGCDVTGLALEVLVHAAGADMGMLVDGDGAPAAMVGATEQESRDLLRVMRSDAVMSGDTVRLELPSRAHALDAYRWDVPARTPRAFILAADSSAHPIDLASMASLVTAVAATLTIVEALT